MPVIQADQAVVHELHGTTFISYARPGSGSRELCGWRVEIPARTEGVPHQVSREEVLYILSGSVRVRIDEDCQDAVAGDDHVRHGAVQEGGGPRRRPPPTQNNCPRRISISARSISACR